MRRLLVVLMASTLVLGLAVTSDAALRKLKKCSASGGFAVCTVSARVSRPKALFVKVTSRPKQRIEAFWSTVCTRGFGAGSKDGRFAGRTPIQRQVRMSYARPDSCSIAASAQLDDRGRIKVILYARV
jgi:hypothetical protein